MQDPQGKTKEIRRLFSAFREGGAALDAEQAVINYLTAVEGWELIDVTAAVAAFITGNAPGVHRGFLPTSAELGGECRRQSGLRFDAVQLDRRLHPPAPPKFEPKDPESRARVKAMAEKFAEEHKPYADFERDLWWTGALPPVGGRRRVA